MTSPAMDLAACREAVETYLAARPVSDGMAHISAPRAYHHAETGYDEQYAIEDLGKEVLDAEAAALTEFLRQQGLPRGAVVLEIGCGTGRLSTSLLRNGHIGALLITDPSPSFLKLARRKLEGMPAAAGRVRYGVLQAEDVGLLPPGSLSAIVLRSVLHHILDVDRFLADCAHVLAPGGMMICEEPYFEGYMMMGVMAQFVPIALAADGYLCTDEDKRHVTLFVDSMKYYCRRDVDKAEAEDKHLFRPEELSHVGSRLGLELEHFPNWALVRSEESNVASRIGYFERFFNDYARYCMNWPQPLVDRTSKAMHPYFAFFQTVESLKQPVPHCFGSFVFRKRLAG